MKKENLAEFYRNHHSVGERGGFVFGGRERAELFSQWIGQGRRVLDLGCRDGALTASYCEGNDVAGVDVDLEALESCRQRLGIEVHWYDLNEPLPFLDHSFDVVVAGEVLEHLVYPAALMVEAARILVPGGMFIGSVPNAFRLKNRILFLFGREYEDDPTHLKRFSLASLGELLSRYFEVEELRSITGRLVGLSPLLFGNTLVWRATKSQKG